MQPTNEDYQINLAAVQAANESATQGEWISIEQHAQNQALMELCLAAMPGILRRLMQAEELLLKLLTAHEKFNIEFDSLNGPTQEEAATIADGMDDFESAEGMLLELAERIIEGRSSHATKADT